MTRRSTATAKTDAMRLPIRLRFRIPPHGFGQRLDTMHRGLGQNIEVGLYAIHSSPALGSDGLAVYFSDFCQAGSFMEAFPELELAIPVPFPATRTPY